jgi:hypothetical protein
MYKRNTEARSRNHLYHGKLISIIYSDCVSVALIIQHAKRMCRVILSSVISLAVSCFSTLFHKRYDFQEKGTEHKMCVLIFFYRFFQNISHSKKNLARYLLTYLLTYLLIYLLTYSMEQSPSWEAKMSWATQEIPRIYETRRFITVFTRARPLSLSWARLIQSMSPHPTSRRSILILSSHLRLGLPSGLLPSGFPSKALYAPILSPIRATCPAHLSFLDLITRMIFGEEYRA